MEYVETLLAQLMDFLALFLNEAALAKITETIDMVLAMVLSFLPPV